MLENIVRILKSGDFKKLSIYAIQKQTEHVARSKGRPSLSITPGPSKGFVNRRPVCVILSGASIEEKCVDVLKRMCRGKKTVSNIICQY